MNKLINLTPHDINVMDEKENIIFTLPKSENPLRVPTSNTEVETLSINGTEVPITETVFGSLEKFPPQKEGIKYIVSRIALAAIMEDAILSMDSIRNDFLVPNDIVRNEKGHTVGCKSFSTN